MNRNESFAAAAIRTLQVHLGWAGVEIVTGSAPDFQVIVSGSDADVNDLRMELNGDKLIIDQPTYGLTPRPLSARWMQVMIRVPSDWKGAVDAGTISGPLSIRDVSGSDIALDTVSAPLHPCNLESITLRMKTVSGAMQGGSLYSEQLNLHTVSGKAELEDCAFRRIGISTVSGDVLMALNAPMEKLDGNSVSGTVRVYAPMDQADVVLKSVSGRLRTGGVSLAEGAAPVRVTTVSGGFEINNNQNA